MVTKAWVIVDFLKEQGVNVGEGYSRFKVEQTDPKDGKIAFKSQFTHKNGCPCTYSRDRGLANDNYKLSEGVETKVVEFTVDKGFSAARGECRYTVDEYKEVQKSEYKKVKGKKYPVKVQTSEREKMKSEHKECEIEAGLSFSTKVSNEDKIAYGVVLAAFGEETLGRNFLKEHKPLIDALKKELKKAK